MDSKAITAAATLLVEARRSGRHLAGLPPELRPGTVAEAHAVQAAATRKLGKATGGWKANAPPDGETQWGVLFEELIFPSPARIPAKLVPLLGVEGEIAFRFLADLPERAADYTREEVAAAVVAFPAIEVVDTRFGDFMKATPLERLADHGSNGAFVAGLPVAGWRALALAKLHVTLTVGEKTIVDQVGGHPTGDPLQPAVALANAMREAGGIRRGQLVTTGSCTGMNFAKPGDSVVARFEGLGTAEVSFTA
ncbi:MAG: 2-keto-4-pentenoate hydratase [Alphaproteobacteria bacterium]